MTTFYLDYNNGSDAGTGADWANAWKTITSGATVARIAPGDIIRIAKSPAPYSIGAAQWNDNSKTVTLSGAATATIENCEAAWTAAVGGDATVALTGVATDAKQGSYCMKITLDAAVQTATMQAYYDIYTHDTTAHDLSAYQKISFWIKNEAAIVENNWTITLCSDASGATPVDTFAIPAIPSTARWVPITLARNGGGNLGNAIKSIAINSGSANTGMASKYVYIDHFIACTTSGLNLQSLISKNSAEQGGTEGWYAVQSIDGTAILLDTDTNTKANAGRGYSGTQESVTTYARETIKTAMASSSTTMVQEVQDSGTLAGGNIQFQGGYNTSSGNQDGETFFDGLNGNGYGLYLSSKSFITFNYLNVCRYSYGIYYTTNSNNNTITTLSNANNNASYGVCYSSGSNNNAITTLSNASNNTNSGVLYSGSNNNAITTLSNANNNASYGVYYSNYSNNNNTITLSNANNNASYGVYYSGSNTITTLSTTGNGTSGIRCNGGWNTIGSATIAESTKVSYSANFADDKIFIQSIASYPRIDYNFGYVVAQAATAGGTGSEWVMYVTNSGRASNYPMKLKLAEIAVGASTQVTVTCYFKKSHATDIAAKLVTPGGELSGVSLTEATCASDVNRNQLQIQFTPSAAGIVSIEAWAWWVSNTADENVIIDDIAVSQA